jgi:hypothetical protein
MSFEEMQAMASASSPAPSAPPAAPEPPPAAAESTSPWDEPEQPAFGGETRGFPKMSFEEMQQMASTSAPPEPSPWDAPAPSFESPAAPAFEDEPPAFSGETRAFPKLNFDDFQSLSSPEPAAPEAASPWAEAMSTPAPEPAWTPEPAVDEAPIAESFPSAASPFSEPASAPFNEPPAAHDAEAVPEDLTFASQAPELEPVESLMSAPAVDEPSWEPVAAAAEPEPEPAAPPAAAPAPAALSPEAPPMAIARGGELSDEQIDRIARRVVELMSDQVVRNIAWEVIPDLAEMVVKERIRQLEAEA